MVSALWNACAAEVEDVESVQQLLKDGVDLEIKDHTGATALVQAVRNNHKQIVKALVAAGADVNQGKLESYTTDPETLALLRPVQEYPDGGFDPMQQYYYPPPGQEGPYPPYPYPMQPDQFDANAQGMPPAEVARNIPCRYFPVCRYGSSCMFLHPPASYFAGPPPPHYPHMYPPHPYYMMRYPPPPPPPATDPATSPVTGTQPFPPIYPNGAPPFSPPTNGAPAFPHNGAAYPNGAPYPPTNGAPYPPTNGTPFSPPSTGTPYTPGTNGTHSPYGPPPFSPGTATPYSAGAPFTPAGPAPYPYPRTYPDAPKEPVNGTTEEPPAQTNNATTNGHPNGGFRRNTRGGRRESFGTRQQQKPPCLFFPSGRCRNGDECRFPHVPLEPGAQPTFRYPPGNNNRFNHRARQSIGHDNPPPAHIPPGTKLPFAPGGQQRVPNADDFPVLGGDKTPAPTANGNSGLTAAQVLQAPAPAKKKESDVVDGLADALSKVHVNGLTTPAFEAPSTTPEITAVGA